MTTIPEVPFSELINRPKATTAKLAESRTHELRLRRRDDVDLVLREAEADKSRSEMVNTAAKFLGELMDGGEETRILAMRVAPKVFPWIRFLPEEEQKGFLDHLAETLKATVDFDDPSPAVHQVIIGWRSSAEVYADPKLLEILTRDHDPDADFGPVPPPPGVVE